jgi:Flp pilus assembly pilin Flp
VAPISKIISRLYKEERGQGLAEYGLIVALVSVAIILVMMNLGETNNNTMNKVASEMST